MAPNSRALRRVLISSDG